MTNDEVAHGSFKETMAARAEMRGRVDAARGRLIAATIVLEDHVDATLVGYFDSVEPERFHGWVISNMTYSNKLELLRKIVKQHGLWEMYGDLLKRIEGLRNERNKAAHASLALREPGVPDGDNVLLSRRSKKGEESTDLDEVNSIADRAERIAQEYIALDYFIHEVHKRELADADPDPKPEC